jgi:predicted Zn-dependent protease
VLTESDPAEAVALAARAYAQAPKNPWVQDTYGAALLAAGDAGQARKLLTQGLRPERAGPVHRSEPGQALAAAGELRGSGVTRQWGLPSDLQVAEHPAEAVF